MILSLAERWILANQLQILENITDDKKEKSSIAYKRKAIENGYEYAYLHIQPICPDDDVVTFNEGKQVIDILSMFRAIDRSLRQIDDTTGLDIAHLRFQGFDGNEEGPQYSFTKYFCIENPERPFEESFPDGVMLNIPHRLPLYLSMIAVWDELKNKQNLTKENLIRIQEARTNS
jgi:uncharacterized protein YfbU (UPF0304 family)